VSSFFRYYASVSTAINGDINGKNAVPTRPSAATAMAPNSKNSNISFHLLPFRIHLLSVGIRTDKPHIVFLTQIPSTAVVPSAYVSTRFLTSMIPDIS